MATKNLCQVEGMLSDFRLTFEDCKEMASLLSSLCSHPEKPAEKRWGIRIFAINKLIWDRFAVAICELYKS
jgi:hypothetical protein